MRIIYFIIGMISFVVGTIGIVVPVLPTVPLYLLAVLCWAKSSNRFHQWFVNSNLYQKHVKDFADKTGITIKKKVKIVLTTLLLMGIGFVFCPNPLGKIVIVICYIVHVLVMFFYIPTKKVNELKSVK